MKNNNQPPPGLMQQGVNLEILKDKPFNGCLLCSCINFIPVYRFKNFTALESSNGLPGKATLMHWQCMDCKHVDGDPLPAKS